MRGLGRLVRAVGSVLVLLTLAAPASAAEVRFGDGGWCWFQDPRAVTHAGAHTRTYVGWVTPAGDVTVGSYDHATKQTTSFVLHAALQRDDHVSPALHVRPDGRLTAFYARHSGAPFYYRTTTNPEDVTSWGPAQTIDTNTPGAHGFTYPNPVRLAAEDRTYLFWRGGDLDPTFSTQDDGETGWADARSLMHVPGDQPGYRTERPYVKYASDGQDTIHFAYTNAHPSEAPDVNIYYGRIRAGRVERADGTDLSALGTPIAPTEAEVVFDAPGPTWIHDVAVGADGRPVVVFASFPTGTSATGHVYHYARWTGASWEVSVITPAGGSISTGGRSPLYSGGITLDHQDPSSLYLSRQVGGAWWVEAWNTPDGGRSWATRTLTPGSTAKNMRPLSPRGDEPNGEMVVWMNGAYPDYNNLETTVTSFIEDPPPPIFSPPPAAAEGQPSPGTPSVSTPPDPDTRTARVRLGSAAIRIGQRGGGRLTIHCTAVAGDHCRIVGSIRHRRARIGSVSGVVRGAKRGTLPVRLTRKGLVRLRRARKLGAVLVAQSTSLSGRRSRVGGPARLRFRAGR